jgi:hypothetical protein
LLGLALQLIGNKGSESTAGNWWSEAATGTRQATKSRLHVLVHEYPFDESEAFGIVCPEESFGLRGAGTVSICSALRVGWSLIAKNLAPISLRFVF